MTTVNIRKRLAAEIKGVGIKRVRIPPQNIDEIEEALTREDVRKLIEDGKIIILQKRGPSRKRHIERARKRRVKSERRGPGSRKGNKKTRRELEKVWVMRVRKMRKYLRYLRDNNLIERRIYRIYYRKVKGGNFKSLTELRNSLIQSNYLKGE
ncbi:50S ribosomal protein L19e [Sulfolobales archaeon HS-7]|nr:50S ribosomal protein L19e [Sulfolobales archaeon HS-7]